MMGAPKLQLRLFNWTEGIGTQMLLILRNGHLIRNGEGGWHIVYVHFTLAYALATFVRLWEGRGRGEGNRADLNRI